MILDVLKKLILTKKKFPRFFIFTTFLYVILKVNQSKNIKKIYIYIKQQTKKTAQKIFHVHNILPSIFYLKPSMLPKIRVSDPLKYIFCLLMC